MRPINYSARQKKMISFGILLFITGGIFFLMLSSLCQGDGSIARAAGKINKVMSHEDKQGDRLVQYDELLHARFNSLHRLDEQYASLVINGANLKSLDSLNVIIHQEEEYFSAAVKSINQNVNLFTDENKRVQFIKMIASFRSAIIYRDAVNSLRSEIAFKTGSQEGPGVDELQKLQEELEEKNNRISMLENSVNILRKVKTPLVKQTKKLPNAVTKTTIKPETKTVFTASANK
jgi:hypothetical protein